MRGFQIRVLLHTHLLKFRSDVDCCRFHFSSVKLYADGTPTRKKEALKDDRRSQGSTSTSSTKAC